MGSRLFGQEVQGYLGEQLGQPLILIWSLTLAEVLLPFWTSRGEGWGDAGGASWR